MEVALAKGLFLIATPGLRDPNFRQTVVLLCEHGPEGALGVVVNRPTQIRVAEMLPEVPVLEGQELVFFSGGPVQPNHVLFLYRAHEEPSESHHVFDGVYLGGDMDHLQRLFELPIGKERFRAYAGYSGWSPGQLEAEMKTGSWLTIPADSTIVFEKDPSLIWPDLMRSMGEPYAFYAEMPPDPTFN